MKHFMRRRLPPPLPVEHPPIPVVIRPPAMDYQPIIDLAVNSMPAARSREQYARALRDFMHWFQADPARTLNRQAVQQYVTHLRDRQLAAASVNLALSAIKKLVREAIESQVITPERGAPILTIRGMPRQQVRGGRWLTLDEAQSLLLQPDTSTVVGCRDAAVLAMLIGGALRRSEAAFAKVEGLEQRAGRWTLTVTRKRGNVQAVRLPAWSVESIQRWLERGGVTTGRILRAVSTSGRVPPSNRGITPKCIYDIVRKYGLRDGARLAPHDLRRTMAAAMLAGGAGLRDIQSQLGHANISTTERYLAPVVAADNTACDVVQFRI